MNQNMKYKTYFYSLRFGGFNKFYRHCILRIFGHERLLENMRRNSNYSIMLFDVKHSFDSLQGKYRS